MSITVQKVDFPKHNATSNETLQEHPVPRNYLNLVKDLEVECQIRLGTLTCTVEALQQLHKGQVLTLNQNLQEPLDILVNQQVIARGELMSDEHYFAIHITEVCN